MYKQDAVLMGLVLLTLAGMAPSAAAKDEQPAGQEHPAHAEIRALRDGVLEAIKKKDADALVGFLHPDVVLTVQDGQELKAIRKHQGVRDYLTRTLTGPQAGVKSFEPTVTVDDLTILHGDDTGVAYGSSRDHYVLADGTQIDVPTRWSATLVKHEGKWKVASLQVSSDPFNNPVLDTAVKRGFLYAGGAAVLGIVLGILVAVVLRRTPRPGT